MIDNAFYDDYFRMTGQKFQVCFKCVANILLRHNVRFMFWYRVNNSFIMRVIRYKYSRKYGIEISPNTKIGRGLYIGHLYNITIGDGVILGDNVNIHKGATIGVENRGKRAGAPTIGNMVYIGINATIIGKVNIGNDVLIAPGAFVNFDVPDHSIVLGNPGQIHSNEFATMYYVRNLV